MTSGKMRIVTTVETREQHNRNLLWNFSVIFNFSCGTCHALSIGQEEHFHPDNLQSEFCDRALHGSII
jgi:hypothetical protein